MCLGRVLVNNFKAMPLGGTIDEQFLGSEKRDCSTALDRIRV
jgi:hypothetical protein